MSEISQTKSNSIVKAAAIAAAFAFLYATVLAKLGRDWWSDENYSHGLLVPFVIAMIIWREWDGLRKNVMGPSTWLGSGVVTLAILLLFAGTLGAELFTQRMSMVLMLAGVIVYLFGTRVLQLLAVPFALLLLAIPIPQIIFNSVDLPAPDGPAKKIRSPLLTVSVMSRNAKIVRSYCFETWLNLIIVGKYVVPA